MTPLPESERASGRQRNDPYGEPKPGRRKMLGWLVRLAFLFLAVVACSAASIVLLARWRESGLGARVQIEGGNPNLGLRERLYLESYLATHAEELEVGMGAPGGETTFVISPGESAGQVAANLFNAGLVADAQLFVNYVRYYGLDSALTAGSFRIPLPVTVPELAMTLTNPYQDIALNFLTGWRLEEMTAYLAATSPGNIDHNEFLAIVQRREAFDLSRFDFLANHPPGVSLEGFLFPGAYDVPVEAGAAELVEMMLTRFGEVVTPAMRQSYGVQGLSLREAVTLASIVARESPLDDEQALIAGVFYNRLALGMPLQADSTVQYALGYHAPSSSWWKAPLSAEDLQVDSPYNSYLHDGLPPGPIANPGRSTLEAVANPAETDFLFFVLDCETEARHLFSVTYEEHLQNVSRCANN